VILDLWYAAFPWFLLWNLNMPRKEKWLIAASMSLGVFAAAYGTKRAIELKKLGSPNYLRDVVGIIIWHAAELCTMLVCIGIPVCRPLYMRWLEGWVSTKQNGERNSHGGGWSRGEEHGSGDGDGIFTMHTIGGSGFKGQKASNNRGRAAIDRVDWQDAPGPFKERAVSVGASRVLNPSCDSMLRADTGASSNIDEDRSDSHVEVVGVTGRRIG
jgi:hypothetical protein